MISTIIIVVTLLINAGAIINMKLYVSRIWTLEKDISM